MAFPFRSTSVAVCLLPLFTLQLCLRCHAAGAVGAAGAAGSSPGAFQTSLRAPGLEDTSDDASFMLSSTEVTLASSLEAQGSSDVTSLAQGIRGLGLARSVSVVVAAPLNYLPDMVEESAWDETKFLSGVQESKKAVEDADNNVVDWAFDSACGAAVPSLILHAETLLQSSADAPPDRWKEKTAERALRVYYHAKWLAERNYARAAEHRYHEAYRLASSARRSVLASHALARLGYFFVHWGRPDEAKSVLKHSMKLNTKSNPLAPFLHGMLTRKTCEGELECLNVAEDQILNSGKQPSEELEVERSGLIAQIGYWREAETSPRHCFSSSDSAYVLICLGSHAAMLLNQILFK